MEFFTKTYKDCVSADGCWCNHFWLADVISFLDFHCIEKCLKEKCMVINEGWLTRLQAAELNPVVYRLNVSE